MLRRSELEDAAREAMKRLIEGVLVKVLRDSLVLQLALLYELPNHVHGILRSLPTCTYA